MADPVGEDGWLSLVDEASRNASDLEQRIHVVELYKNATTAEPWALKLWMAYCEWFWSLHTDCQTADAGWPQDEQLFGQEVFSLGDALNVWQQGAQATQFRLNDSHQLWNRWISIELEELSKNPTKENVQRVRHIFLDRLQTPHATWEDTSQTFSAFLTKYENAAYESTMVEVTRLSMRAKDLYSQREVHESKLARAIESGDIEAQKYEMREYLDWEGRQTRVRPKKGKEASPLILCVALYERALSSTALGLDPAIWQDYIVFIAQNQQAQSIPSMLSVIKRATMHCPSSGTLWARYILTAEAERLPHSDIEFIKHAATNSNLDRDGMGSVVEVYIAWCGYLSRRGSAPGAPDEDADVAEMGLRTALESVREWGQNLHGKDYKGDPLFRIERIMIQYLTHKLSFAEARGYWKDLVTTHGDSYDFWQQYYLWEMTVRVPNTPPSLATEVLIGAVHRPKLDWPEKMLEIYLRHCNIYADAESLLTAMNTVHILTKLVVRRREKEAAMYAQQQPVVEEAAVAASPPSASKRKREVSVGEVDGNSSKKLKSVEKGMDSEQLKRDRENTTVYVANLPPGITQTKVRQYFKDYGHINQLKVHEEANKASSTALIEFRSYEDVQAALIRDGKYFNDKQIRVEAASGCTIYVTNYEPAADDNYIRDLFKDCGEIFDIRWPSLKVNTHRRFCYVTFRSHEAAASATKLDGHRLPNGFKLSALYSDPSKRKAREGAMQEGRELHVTGLDDTLNEDDLKEVFSKYGNVESVRILRTGTQKSKGAGFVVFESKDDAATALELDKTKLKSRVMTVELSVGKNFKPIATSKGTSASPAPSGDGNPAMSPSPAPDTHTTARNDPLGSEKSDRTITLMNLPDTVNDARVRAVAEPHGSISKIVLRPDHQGAIIEYSDAPSAGRAALALENYEITPGRKLRIGGLKDLFVEKSEVKIDRIQIGQEKKTPASFIQPSAPVRRPGAGGRGGLGTKTKKGLGYSAPRPSSGSSAAAGEMNGNGKVDENVPQKKSNADFKAMFVSGGRQ